MKVLLLCSSHNDLGLINALIKMGFEVIVTGNVENLPGQKYADRFIKADYSDKELILEIARMEKIDRICPCCNDFGVYTAAYVAEQMGLPGYDSYDTTLTLNNKDRFKKLAKELDILTPESEKFTDEESAVQYTEDCLYPIIIKPVDLSAGNGIHRADTPDEAKSCIHQALEKSRNHRIVIEPFITGTQHGFCTYLIDQKVVAVCSNNEYSIQNPYRVEIDTFPADTYTSAKDILIPEIERIAEHLHLVDGIFHLQYIMQDGKPQIIEVMRRVLGNMYGIPAQGLTGIDWDYWEARARVGFSLDHFPINAPQEGNFAYKTILAPTEGTITQITIPENEERFITQVYLLKHEGDVITDHLSQPVGFIFYRFARHKDMIDTLITRYHNDLVSMR
jgi:biotin carboxylase